MRRARSADEATGILTLHTALCGPSPSVCKGASSAMIETCIRLLTFVLYVCKALRQTDQAPVQCFSKGGAISPICKLVYKEPVHASSDPGAPVSSPRVRGGLLLLPQGVGKGSGVALGKSLASSSFSWDSSSREGSPGSTVQGPQGHHVEGPPRRSHQEAQLSLDFQPRVLMHQTCEWSDVGCSHQLAHQPRVKRTPGGAAEAEDSATPGPKLETDQVMFVFWWKRWGLRMDTGCVSPPGLHPSPWELTGATPVAGGTEGQGACACSLSPQWGASLCPS